MKNSPILYTFNTYPFKKGKNPLVTYFTFFGCMLLALSMISLSLDFIGNKNRDVYSELTYVTQVAGSTFTKDSDYTATPDESNNIIFEKKSPGPRTALVKITPEAAGEYLYFGPLCVVQIAKEDKFEQVAMDGEVASLTDLDKNEYFVDCDKEKGTEMFSFRILYADRIGAGTGGADLYPYQINNAGIIAAPQDPALAQSQINYTFAPSNTFSPTIVNTQPAPTPTPTSNALPSLGPIPLPSVIP